MTIYQNPIQLKLRHYVREFLEDLSDKNNQSLNSVISTILENYVDDEIKNGNAKERLTDEIKAWHKVKASTLKERIIHASNKLDGCAISTIIQKSKSAKFNKDAVIETIDRMIANGELRAIKVTNITNCRSTTRYTSII